MRYRTALIGAGVVLLSACGGTQDASSPASAAPVASHSPSGEPSTGDGDFVRFMHVKEPWTVKTPDSDLLALGYAVCHAIEAGATEQQVLAKMPGDTGTEVMVGSVFFLCPEQAHKVL